ncbi:Spo11/DNA topoisomerase VI subunit A [Nitzschia inconspicua]|uniref:Ribosomal RNA-processing protein 8 n=1 Tax=Nitzschia inconspicua TaxID=303405 RepID=A0A9K3KYS7_9STRA|nr:Spo11/DNA topoisomerase VI subunit A [Nitzschia inconspicua]
MAKEKDAGRSKKLAKRKSIDKKEPSQNLPTKKRRRKSSEQNVSGKSNKDVVAKATDSTVPTKSISDDKWSKSKKKRMRKILAKQKLQGTEENPSVRQQSKEPLPSTTDHQDPTSIDNNNKKSSIQDAFKARLAGSRFRMINEELYTTTSQESYERFSQHPELFEQYHQGFRHQVESWPENPVDVLVRSLTKTYSNNFDPKKSRIVVADFGCGDAQLAKDLLQVKGKNGDACPFQVHSFDLVAPNELVTACDMANVPLSNESVDVCIFCLSLMGTNLADFVREAHRVLKKIGRVHIAEVRSRIEYSHSNKTGTKDKKKQGKSSSSERKDKNSSNDKSNIDSKVEGTLDEFLMVLDKLGFECVKKDRSNTMFVMLELKKNGKKPDRTLDFSAKPCIYKRR